MSLTAQQFVELVQKSQLVPADRLQVACDGLRESLKGQPSEQQLRLLCVGLVDQGLLTRWHIKNLITGKTRGYFLGNYKLLDHLGRGGMGTVYLAEHIALQRRVAVKVLPSSWVQDATFIERFQREARVIASLDHPNIVRAYDFDRIDGAHFLVLEYIAGKDLASLVRQRESPLPIADVADYLSQAALGLHHAHEKGIVHRDVKPSNLLIDANGCLKVLDLGLARLSQDETSSVTVANNQQLLGTADYLAPEQALNSHSADHRADIYSLGCTLFYALTGRPPFHEGTIAQKIAQHQVAERPLVQAIRPEVPQSLGDLCRRMMDKDPAQRVASALEVATSLREIASELAALKLKASTATSENSAVPVVDKNPFDVIESVPLLHATESEPSFKDRRPRATRSKRPPILFWIFILVLVVVAIVLAVMVKLQHA